MPVAGSACCRRGLQPFTMSISGPCKTRDPCSYSDLSALSSRRWLRLGALAGLGRCQLPIHIHRSETINTVLRCAALVRYLQAQFESFVLVVTVRWAIMLMLASASPRNPYVPIDSRSSNAFSFEVVNRSHRIGRSSRCLCTTWKISTAYTMLDHGAGKHLSPTHCL